MDLKPYIYDNGFHRHYFICSQCGGKAMKQEPRGGFQPPIYYCMECGSADYAPKWETIVEPYIPEEEVSEAWISDWDLAEIIVIHKNQLN